MKCAFCDIVNGKIASYSVLEDEFCFAFLDKRPLFPGHCLLVPKQHTSTLVEINPKLIEPVFADARLLSAAVELALDAEGTFVAINNKVSQSVPHLHIHVVPRKKGDGLKGFFWPRNPYRDEGHTQDVQHRIREAIGAVRKTLF